MSSSEQQATN